MKFEIDFNRFTTDKHDDILEAIGAIKENAAPESDPPNELYFIELNSFEDLEVLLQKVNQHFDKQYYSAIISFDHPTIYLDNNL